MELCSGTSRRSGRLSEPPPLSVEQVLFLENCVASATDLPDKVFAGTCLF